MSKSANLPDPNLAPANIDADELATNQQTVVVPWFCGEAKFALKWLCEPFDQFTRPAPQERPTKK